METLGNYFTLHPEKRYLALSCTEEVAIGEEGTPIRLDVAIPPTFWNDCDFVPRKGNAG